jgi:hypothetical protein
MDNQDNREFLLAFDTYISFLHKYTPSTLTNTVFTGFKSNYKNDFANLAKQCDNIKDIPFCDSFIKLFKLYADLKLKDRFFYQDILYFRLLNILKEYTNSTDLPSNSMCNFSSDQVTFLKKHIDLFNAAILNSTNEIQSFSQSSTFNKPKKLGIDDINPSAFVNFNDSKDFISSLYDKLLRYENHVKIFTTHLENNTTPSALFYNKFPEPFLNDDVEYVQKYNNLIAVFQAEAIILSKSFLEKRINTLNSKLNSIKDNLSRNNSEIDINKCFSEIISHQNSNLKERFEKANTKATRAKSIPFKAGRKFIKTSSQNRSFVSDSASNTSRVSNASTSTSILRNSGSNNNAQDNRNNYNRNQPPRHIQFDLNSNSNHNSSYNRNSSTNYNSSSTPNTSRYYNSNNQYRQTRHSNNLNSTSSSSNFNPYQSFN